MRLCLFEINYQMIFKENFLQKDLLIFKMNQSNRVCKMKGHNDLPIFHVCTLLECNQPKRWCCSECNSLGMHNHNKPNNSHVM